MMFGFSSARTTPAAKPASMIVAKILFFICFLFKNQKKCPIAAGLAFGEYTEIRQQPQASFSWFSVASSSPLTIRVITPVKCLPNTSPFLPGRLANGSIVLDEDRTNPMLLSPGHPGVTAHHKQGSSQRVCCGVRRVNHRAR